MLLALAHRAAIEGSPVGRRAAVHRQRGGRARGREGLRRHAPALARSATSSTTPAPIGEIVVASPTAYRLEAQLPRPRGARRDPPRGRAQRDPAPPPARSRRCALGRLDEETTANVAAIHGGVDGTNVVPEHCSRARPRRARSTSDASRRSWPRWSTAARRRQRPGVRMRRRRDDRARSSAATATRAGEPQVAAAEAALRALRLRARAGSSPAAARTPTRSAAAGLPCTNLANGTERQPRADRARQRGRAGGDARRDLRAARTSSRRDCVLVLRRGTVVQAPPPAGPEQRLVVDVPGRGPRGGDRRRRARRRVRARRRRGGQHAGRRPGARLGRLRRRARQPHARARRRGPRRRARHEAQLHLAAARGAAGRGRPSSRRRCAGPSPSSRLHGQLAPLAWALAAARPGARLGFVQTRGRRAARRALADRARPARRAGCWPAS